MRGKNARVSCAVPARPSAAWRCGLCRVAQALSVSPTGELVSGDIGQQMRAVVAGVERNALPRLAACLQQRDAMGHALALQGIEGIDCRWPGPDDGNGQRMARTGARRHAGRG
jgi:hypothetical protein